MLLSLSCRQKTAQTVRHRMMWRALLLSAGLHALLVFSVWPLPVGRTYQPLFAKLGATIVPAESVAPQAFTPKPRQAVVTGDNHSVEKKTGSPRTAKKFVSDHATTMPVTTTPQAPLLSLADQLDSNGLIEFRVNLALKAQRFRPRLPDLHGKVEVRVHVTAAGRLSAPEVAQSSGQSQLDAAVIEMLRQAMLQTTVPPSLRGKSFSLLVPIEVGAAER